MAAQKGNLWLTIVYPESAPEDWISKLKLMGVTGLISPLHDKDTAEPVEVIKEQGQEVVYHDQKKAHYHVALYWPTGTTNKDVAQGIVKSIGGVGCIKGASLRGTARYHCHMDDPHKYQYDKNDEIVLGGIDYFEIINSISDDILCLHHIFDFCEKLKIYSYRELMIFCRTYCPEWERVIIKSQRENVYRYLRSLEYDMEKEGGTLYRSQDELVMIFESLGGAKLLEYNT